MNASRRLVAGAAALFIAAVTLFAAPAFAAPDAPTSSAARHAAAAGAPVDPVSRFGACLTDGGEGDLLLLIDESGSLQSTDPKGNRVTAVSYLLRQLATFADNAQVTLNVKFAVFGHRYKALGDWVVLGKDSSKGLLATAKKLAGYDDGFDTDYWTALERSRRELAEKAATRPDAEPCQAIAWFTDGQLDYDPRVSDYQKNTYGATKPFAPDIPLNSESAAKKVAAIATQLICTDGGLADQLRSSDIVMFAIGLDAKSNIDFSLVQSIATGGPSNCGAITDPVPGIFTTANDIDDLLFAFDALSTPGQNPIHTEAGICQGSTCVEESHKIVLDNSTPVVHILASADVDGLQVSLISPTNQVYELEPKTVNQQSTFTGDAGTATYTWQSARTLAIDLSRTGDGWSGLWQLSFVDPDSQSPDGKSFSNVRISSDFRPAVKEPKTDTWYRDETVDLELGILTGEEFIDPETIEGTLQLSARLVGSDGTELEIGENLTKADLQEVREVSLKDFPLGQARLVLDLIHTTAPATVDGQQIPGTRLEPQTIEIGIPIAPPLDFPLVPNRLAFTLDGVTTATADLGLDGKGCVWLDADSLKIAAGPEEAGKIVVTAPATGAEDCLPVSEGSLPITLTSDALANGSVNGSVVINLAPSNAPDRAIPTTVEFTADMRKPFNPTVGSGTFVAALLLGIGIPVGLIYLLKFLIAKIPSRALLSQRIPVVVDDGRVLRGGAPFALREDDLRDVTGIKSGGTRSLDIAGVTLRTKVGASPAGAGYVVVESPGFVGASSGIPASAGKRHWARLPLAVHNQWVVLRPAGAATRDVEVLLLVSGDADRDRRQQLEDDIIGRLPDVLARLDEIAGDEPVRDDTDSGWGDSKEGAGFDFDSETSSGATSSESDSGYSGFGFSNWDDDAKN